MSIQSEIQDLQTNLAAINAAIVDKGGSVSETGLAGVATEIEALPEGGGELDPPTYGRVFYHSKQELRWCDLYPSEGMFEPCVLPTVLDEAKLYAFIEQIVAEHAEQHQCTSMQIYPQSENEQIIWMFFDRMGYRLAEIPNNQVESIAGIQAIDSIPYDPRIEACTDYKFSPDLTSPLTSVDLASLSELTQLCAPDGWSKRDTSTINDVTIACNGVVKFEGGTDMVALPNYFFCRFDNLETVSLQYATSVASVGEYVFAYCPRLNCPFDLSNLAITSIGGGFLAESTSFNSALMFPTTLLSIGQSFLYRDAQFNQPLALPNHLTTIANYFLSGCSSFNQPLSLPTTLTSIGGSFLYGCSAFNQSVVLPIGITAIQSYFMSGCTSYNATLVIPEGVTTIGPSFMQGCEGFNKAVVLPSTIISIAERFLSYISAMCATVDVGSLAATVANASGESFATLDNTSPAYTTGITIKGTTSADWLTRFPNGKTGMFYRNLIDGEH